MLAQVLTGSALAPLHGSWPDAKAGAREDARGAFGLARSLLAGWPSGLVALLPLLLVPGTGSPSDLGRTALLLVALTLLAEAGALLGRRVRGRSMRRAAEAGCIAAAFGAAGCLLAGALDPSLRFVALALLAVEVTLGLGRGRAVPLVASLAGAAAALHLEATAILLDLPHGSGLTLVAFLLGLLVALSRERRERLLRAAAATQDTDAPRGKLLDLGLGIASAGLVGLYLALLAGTPAASAGPLVYLSVPLGLGALLRWWRIAAGDELGRSPATWLRDPPLALLVGGWAVSLGLTLHLLPAIGQSPGALHLVAPIW